MNKTFKILEIIWLVLACVGVFMSVYSLFAGDYRGAVYFLAFFIISTIMYLVRKRQRKKLENPQNPK